LPWQPVTYILINPEIWGLLFNCLAIWMFGNVLEQRMGTKKYITTFLISGFSSSILFFILCLSMGNNFPYFGMMAPVLSLLVCFAYFWPNSRVYIFGIFPIKSKFLVLGYGILMLFSMSSGFTGKASYALIYYTSALAGVLLSIIFVHFVFLEYSFLRSFIRKFKNSLKKEKIIKSTKNSSSPKKAQGEKVVSKDDWERRQVDILLEKVSKYGIKSLNRKEKDFLDRVSATYSSKEDEM